MPTFTPRLNDSGMLNNPKWYSENPFYQAGYGLPNCTCYAWGRFWEINGFAPNTLSTGNANTWYDRSYGFLKGTIPQLGAIMCWDYGSGGSRYGHVAVVEEIYSDGTLLVSESGYSARWYFKTERTDSNYYLSWMYGYSNLKFQGFIYARGITGDGSEYHWKSITQYQSEYLNDDTINNCYCVAGNLLKYNWTLEAICGILGNAIKESFCSADLYELGGEGYGILQWTPYTKVQDWLAQNYPTWQTDLDVNGNGQCARLKYEYDNNIEYYHSSHSPHNFTWETFVESRLSPDVLAECFMWDYERPRYDAAVASLAERKFFAIAIYMEFTKTPPGTIITPTDKRKPRKMPVWMMIKYHAPYRRLK